jgi:hypothetical protein
MTGTNQDSIRRVDGVLLRTRAAAACGRSGLWTQPGFMMHGSGVVGPAGQGHSVALSADGNSAIVGGHLDNIKKREPTTGGGAAWVFTRVARAGRRGPKLVGSGAVGLASQGYSVALSADGNTTGRE